MVRQETIGQRLRRFRDELGLDQGDLERRSGIPRSHISMIETGVIDQPRRKTLRALEKGLGAAYEGRLTGSSPPISLREAIKIAADALERDELVEVPVRGSVPAGVPFPAEDQPTGEMVWIERTLLAGVRDVKSVYAVKVKGESLRDDGIHDGEKMAVTSDVTEVSDGLLYLIEMNNEVVARHAYRRGRMLHLESANDEYEDINIEEARVVARVLASGDWRSHNAPKPPKR